MPVDVTGLRTKVRRHAEEMSRAASADVETELREKVKDLGQWDYTHARRDTFLPHLALHGIEFDGPTDPVLANPESWPPVSHFHPQDHKGCRCRTRRSRRGVRRLGLSPTRWRILSEAPKVGPARAGSARIAVSRSGMPAWAEPILSRTNWIAALRRNVRGRNRV